MTRERRNAWIKDLARRAGFDLCAVAPAEPIDRADYLREWLAAGRAGSMDYLHRHLPARIDPRELLESARSVVMVALNYHRKISAPPTANPSSDAAETPTGRIAMYAWGRDYHEVLKKRLFPVADALNEEGGPSTRSKVCVDTAPLLEREFARRSGLGWIGKNTMVIHPEWGSYFFLGAIVTTLDIASDPPMLDHCGTCTRCLQACPTEAFPAPYQMDASRCISYLTIERRADIPEDLGARIGEWVYGCDVCQEVCPHNRKAPETLCDEFQVRAPAPRVRLDEVLNWSEADYRERLRGSAMKRATLAMWKRNARITLDHPTPPSPDDDDR